MFEFDKAIRGIALAGAIMLVSGVAANSVVAVPDGRAPFAQVAESTPPPQLIANFERLLRSATGQRVAASGDVQAQRLLADARAQLDAAKAALAAGDATAARAAAHAALLRFMDASRRVPSEDGADRQAQAQRYQNLRQGIDVFLQAHQRNAGRLATAEGGEAVVAFDADAVTRLVREAEQQAASGDYLDANLLLTEAQRQVTSAIRAMMQHRTLVNDIKIASPAEEYQYELQRHQGYVELIPVAIEVRTPPAEMVASMKATAIKAQAMVQRAKDTADAGDYPVAIRMVLDATDEVRAALRQAGVEM